MRVLVHDFLRQTAQRTPEQTALITSDGRTSFADLDRQSDQLAAALQAAGVRRGARVVLFLDNCAAAVCAAFAVLKAGGVFVMVNPATKAAKLRYLLEDSGARVLIAHAQFAPVVAGAAGEMSTAPTVIWTTAPAAGAPAGTTLPEILAGPAARPADPGLIDNDLSMILYTSGSTGEPKGVMLTHRNVTTTAWSISTYLGNAPDDVIMCVLPLSFGYGLYQVLCGAQIGYGVVLERSFAFPYQTLQLMQKHRVTAIPGVPTIFATLMQLEDFTQASLPTLRYMTNAGAAIPTAHLQRLRQLFPQTRIFSMYGQTECMRVCYLEPELLESRINSVGKAMPNTEVYLVDEDGRRLPPGSTGLLVVRGAHVMRGYWRKPQATANSLRDGDIPGEKVLHTGDWFRMDEEGFLYFVGRSDDVFKCKGEKVSPKEVENVLYELDGVSEAAVIGVPDPLDGQAVKAFIVPRPEAVLTEQQVKLHCRGRLEPYMVPRFVELCTALPKTDSGKIKRAALKAAAT